MSWSDLPAELVARIADKISEHVDLARFRSVCPSWRSASAEHAARRRVPLLLLPSRQYTNANRRLWSLADSITETPMPAACGRSFLYASPRGWTLGVADDLSATLLHPFTGASEILPALPPSFDDVHQEILHQMAWDRSPDAVMISGGTGAYFCRLPADGGSWSPTGSSQRPDVSRINYCDGMFYLHDKRSDWVTAVDIVTFAVVAAIEPPDYDVPWCIPERTLVVSSGELLLLVKMRLLFRGEAQSLFKVFRADCRNLAAGWSEIVDGGIGDRAVFVDHLHGFCVEANGHNGVRRNCVYMASSQEVLNDDDRSTVGGRYTVSVLDLDDLTTQSLSDGNLLNCMCDRFWQWPSWIMPNLHHHHRERDSKL